MTDPYTALGAQILAAARRQEAGAHSSRWAARRRRRHLRIALAVLVLLLAGATIALAASGLLNGTPVKPGRGLDPTVGEGIPAAGASRLLSLRVTDPHGGPPWGMRVVRTTRGEVCVQIGRVLNGQLGELGVDGAFGNDRRFHALAPDVLPSYGQSANAFCVPAGETFSGSSANLDRNATSKSASASQPAQQRREASFGLLGAHALDVTYRTQRNVITAPVTAGVGAYLIIAPAEQPAGPVGFSSAFGELDRRRPSPWGAVSAITYRFARLICTDGTGAPVTRRCPTPIAAPSSTILPTRSLDRPLRITLGMRQRYGYGGRLEFTAPYAVRNAHQVYEVLVLAPPGCQSGGTSGQALERDIARGQRVQVKLDFLFQFAQRCGRTQTIEVRFINAEGPSAAYPHESVIVGAATVTEPPSADR